MADLPNIGDKRHHQQLEDEKDHNPSSTQPPRKRSKSSSPKKSSGVVDSKSGLQTNDNSDTPQTVNSNSLSTQTQQSPKTATESTSSTTHTNVINLTNSPTAPRINNLTDDPNFSPNSPNLPNLNRNFQDSSPRSMCFNPHIFSHSEDEFISDSYNIFNVIGSAHYRFVHSPDFEYGKFYSAHTGIPYPPISPLAHGHFLSHTQQSDSSTQANQEVNSSSSSSKNTNKSSSSAVPIDIKSIINHKRQNLTPSIKTSLLPLSTFIFPQLKQYSITHSNYLPFSSLTLQVLQLQFLSHKDVGLGKQYPNRSIVADSTYQFFAEFYDEALLKMRSVNQFNVIDNVRAFITTRCVARGSSIAVLVILNFDGVYPATEPISSFTNMYQCTDVQPYAIKMPIYTFFSNDEFIYKFFCHGINNWKKMTRVDKAKINCYTEHVIQTQVDKHKSIHSNSTDATTSPLSSRSSARPKSLPPSLSTPKTKHSLSSDDDDLHTQNLNVRNTSIKSQQQAKNKAQKIKLLDSAKITNEEGRAELLLLSVSILKAICKEKIRYRNVKRQNQQLISEKKQIAQQLQSLNDERKDNSQLLVNSQSSNNNSYTQREMVNPSETLTENKDAHSDNQMSMDSNRSHRSSRSQHSSSNQNDIITSFDSLPQRVKKEKRKKKHNADRIPKINLNILNQAINTSTEMVADLPHYPFDEALPEDVDTAEFKSRFRSMTPMCKTLHPLWMKYSLKYQYDDGKKLTVTYGLMKQLQALLTDPNDIDALNLVLKTINMSDSTYGQLAKFGGFALNNYRSGRMLVCEEYTDANDATMGVFQMGQQVRN